MNIYMIILNLILLINYVYAEEEVFNEDECKPVNQLLGNDLSYNCCSIQNITCSNGHIVKL